MYTKESLNIVREKEKITFPILRDLIKLLDNNEMKPFSICDSNAVRAYSKFKRSSHDFDIIFPNSINRELLVKQFPAIKYHKKVNNADFYRMETIIPTLNQPTPFYIDFHISGYILDNPLKIFLVDSMFFDNIKYRKIDSINDSVKIMAPVTALEELFLLKIRKFFQLDHYDILSMLIDNKINTEYIYKRSVSLQIFDEIQDKLNSLLKLTNSEAFLEMWNSIFNNELDNPEYLILNKNLSEIIKGLNVISR